MVKIEWRLVIGMAKSHLAWDTHLFILIYKVKENEVFHACQIFKTKSYKNENYEYAFIQIHNYLYTILLELNVRDNI